MSGRAHDEFMKIAARIQILSLLPCLPDDLRKSVESARAECANPQWDGTACQAIEDATWHDAVKIAIRLGFYLGEPKIAPCPDGSVHVAWRLPNDRGNFTVETRDGRLVWSISSLGFIEGEAADLTELTRLAIQTKAQAEAT